MFLNSAYETLLNEDVLLEAGEIGSYFILNEKAMRFLTLDQTNFKEVYIIKKNKMEEKMTKKNWKYITSINDNVKEYINGRNERLVKIGLRLEPKTFNGKIIVLEKDLNMGSYIEMVDFLCLDNMGKIKTISLKVKNMEARIKDKNNKKFNEKNDRKNDKFIDSKTYYSLKFKDEREDD